MLGELKPKGPKGASASLTMGYHYGPSANLLVLVCVSAFPLWDNSHPFDTLYPVLTRSSVKGGLM